mmetsp:Transcript_26709/g.48367  ORF Transcript_26709/g.48367 Transcript_26709/m.48367 type:complete len:140 (+) Transcript_26709:501-920(+)
MLCAGAAGDSATAKAILLASEVRKMDQLRTIGPDDHLRQIRGESTPREATPVLNDGLEMEELLDGAASLDSTKYSSSNALETRGQDGTVAKSSNRKMTKGNIYMELILENFQRFCLLARKRLIVIVLACSGLDDIIKDI